MRNKFDPKVEERLKSLQIRLGSGVFRTAAQERMDETVEQLQGVLDSLIRRIDPDRIECENVSDVHKLSIAVSGLSRASTEASKLKLESQNQYHRAMREWIEQMRDDLRDEHPELVLRLQEIAAGAAEKVSKKKRVGRPTKKGESK
ncbi:MAG: hypothetical protein WC647_03950 [Desulfomonilaceae bacterium]|jgi:hypothetical protein